MRKIIPIIILISIIVLLAACSESADQETSSYTGPFEERSKDDFTWQKLLAPNVTFYYQPDPQLESRAIALKDKFYEIFVDISAVLGRQQFEPVEFYCYRDSATLTKYTSMEMPFYEGDKIFYGYGPMFGELVANYLIAKLPEQTRFHFIAEGLPILLDYTGHNYHHTSNNFLVDGKLTPLMELTYNFSFDTLSIAKREIEAASLIGYMMYEYGYVKVMELYYSKSDIQTAVKEIFQTDIEQLEQSWIKFLPEHTVEKEREREEALKEGSDEQ